jgi:hypothetical protein
VKIFARGEKILARSEKFLAKSEEIFAPSMNDGVRSENCRNLYRNSFNTRLTVSVILYTCDFVSVLIDLFFGVKRAKRLKTVRTSFGYRRTITKLTSYFGLTPILSITDIAASVIFKMPYFTVIGTIGIITVEDKSVFENIKITLQ